MPLMSPSNTQASAGSPKLVLPQEFNSNTGVGKLIAATAGDVPHWLQNGDIMTHICTRKKYSFYTFIIYSLYILQKTHYFAQCSGCAKSETPSGVRPQIFARHYAAQNPSWRWFITSTNLVYGHPEHEYMFQRMFPVSGFNIFQPPNTFRRELPPGVSKIVSLEKKYSLSKTTTPAGSHAHPFQQYRGEKYLGLGSIGCFYKMEGTPSIVEYHWLKPWFLYIFLECQYSARSLHW